MYYAVFGGGIAEFRAEYKIEGKVYMHLVQEIMPIMNWLDCPFDTLLPESGTPVYRMSVDNLLGRSPAVFKDKNDAIRYYQDRQEILDFLLKNK